MFFFNLYHENVLKRTYFSMMCTWAFLRERFLYLIKKILQIHFSTEGVQSFRTILYMLNVSLNVHSTNKGLASIKSLISVTALRFLFS